MSEVLAAYNRMCSLERELKEQKDRLFSLNAFHTQMFGEDLKKAEKLREFCRDQIKNLSTPTFAFTKLGKDVTEKYSFVPRIAQKIDDLYKTVESAIAELDEEISFMTGRDMVTELRENIADLEQKFYASKNDFEKAFWGQNEHMDRLGWYHKYGGLHLQMPHMVRLVQESSNLDEKQSTEIVGRIYRDSNIQTRNFVQLECSDADEQTFNTSDVIATYEDVTFDNFKQDVESKNLDIVVEATCEATAEVSFYYDSQNPAVYSVGNVNVEIVDLNVISVGHMEFTFHAESDLEGKLENISVDFDSPTATVEDIEVRLPENFSWEDVASLFDMLADDLNDEVFEGKCESTILQHNTQISDAAEQYMKDSASLEFTISAR